MTDAASPAYLARQYADDRNLAARQSIYEYQQPRRDVFGGALDVADLAGDERVLDVGCGNGRYLAELRRRSHRGPLIGVDQSAGMLTAAGGGPLVVGDVQALPFPDRVFDVALAMHMLYHVADRAAALAELRRVVRPGGVVLALTNSESHLRELDEVFGASARAFLSFTSENGAAELSAVFAQVELHEFVSELVLTEVEPVLTYARSMSVFASAEQGQLDSRLDDIAARTTTAIARDGALRVRTAVGCFVCR